MNPACILGPTPYTAKYFPSSNYGYLNAIEITVAGVPEPTSAALLLGALTLLVGGRRR